MYSVSFYSPDDHIEYDFSIMEDQGVGGGITSRLRMAQALAKLGHDVRAYINCPAPGIHEGVTYSHFSAVKSISCDVLIAGSSGGKLDLSSLNSLNINSKLLILMGHGSKPPLGIDLFDFDFLYMPSNYANMNYSTSWGYEESKTFVTYRGVTKEKKLEISSTVKHRSPLSLCYIGHPRKGIENAVQVLDSLNQADVGFKLNVFGSEDLWGEINIDRKKKDNIKYFGTIGQKNLRIELPACSYALFLQDSEESFGISLIEAMASGCIVIASSIRAFSEIIRNRIDGFLLQPKSSMSAQIIEATAIIEFLNNHKKAATKIRENSISAPQSWGTIAQTWTDHWDFQLNKGDSTSDIVRDHCPLCNHQSNNFADGQHCPNCATYFPTQMII